MRINENDIMDEVDAHIRKFGGDYQEWCVGTAKDSQAPFFRRHLEADLGDQLMYREAYTTYAADGSRTPRSGLRVARGPQVHPAAEGRIVFVYRSPAVAHAATR